MLKFVVALQRVMELLHAQRHGLVRQRVDLLRRDALYIIVVDVLPVCDTCRVAISKIEIKTTHKCFLTNEMAAADMPWGAQPYTLYAEIKGDNYPTGWTSSMLFVHFITRKGSYLYSIGLFVQQ